MSTDVHEPTPTTPRATSMSTRVAHRSAWLVIVLIAATQVASLSWAPANAGAFQVGPEAVPVPKAPAASAGYGLGAIVVTNSAGWRQILPRADGRGVLVLAAPPGTPAAAAYLTRGDVIVAIDQDEVGDTDKFSLLLQRATQPIHLLSVVSPQGNVRSITATFTTKKLAIARYLASLDITKHDPVSQFLISGDVSNMSRAAAAAKALVEDNPSFGIAYISRARRSLDSLRLSGGNVSSNDDARSAADDVLKAVEVGPEELDVLVDAAEIQLGLRDFTGAETYAQKATLIDPGSSHAYEALGNARAAQGRSQEALADLRRAIELNPYNPQYYDTLAKAYSDVGATAAAASTSAVARHLAGPQSAFVTSRAQSGVATAVFAVVAAAVLSVLFQGIWSTDSTEERQLSSRILVVVGNQQLPALEVVGLVGLWALAVPLSSSLFGVSPALSLQRAIVTYGIPGCALVIVSAVGLMRWFFGRPGGRRVLGIYGAIGLVCAIWLLAAQGQTFIRVVQGRQAIGTLLLYTSAGIIATLVSSYVIWISTVQGQVATGQD